MTSHMTSKNLVLIANYNQAKEISNYLDRVLENFSTQEVVVVDDGSNDGSDAIARQKGFTVLTHPHNMGIGAALRTGLRYGLDKGFTKVLISSSNGKMIPAEFKKLLDTCSDETPYVQGSRFMLHGRSQKLPLFRRVTIPFLSFVFSILFRQKMTDITCGLRAYQLSLLKHPSIRLEQKWLNRYELEYYLHFKFLIEMKIRFVEMPVTITYSHIEPGRKSKIRPFSGWWSMARPFIFLFLKLKS